MVHIPNMMEEGPWFREEDVSSGLAGFRWKLALLLLHVAAGGPSGEAIELERWSFEASRRGWMKKKSPPPWGSKVFRRTTDDGRWTMS
ncbi:hypothetical protein ED733_005299 [Metarhizium rileyi]|uniref:Uncharacterized protein n=1 Tax=Metarhizium rileyi (strain RCEF 4871) TaxID=1649241 RepID=A0A5C6GM28_METRR|nr:hypothetical protein ED733_005299 [Metarhizium rileyi]